MEQISALMDNELSPQDSGQALRRLGDTPEAMESWETYHLIGDTLRGQAGGVNVAARVSAALQNEPTVLAPRRTEKPGKTFTYALSAAASVSAIAVVGWMAFSTGPAVNPQVELAKAVPAASAVQSAEPQLVSSPSGDQMNEYLLAHQGVSPSSGLQGVAPYIRTISATTQASR
jgi:sigma-E factor negative regulatory protein RseA